MDDLMDMFALSTGPAISSNMCKVSGLFNETVDNRVSGCSQQNDIAQMPAFLMWQQSTDNHNSNMATGLASPPNGPVNAKSSTAAEDHNLASGRDGTSSINSDQMCFGAVNDQNVLMSPISGLQAHVQQEVIRPLTFAGCGPTQAHLSYGGSSLIAQIPHGAIVKPTRVRARRGQATNPHSVAERLRRERIAKRMKALQELVPIVNKIDKACMLDDVIEYVKFLQLQVKILSMSTWRGTSLIASDIDVPILEGVMASKSTNNGGGFPSPSPSEDNMAVTENQVAKLMEKNIGSALQFLQSKGLCLMPITLATTLTGSTQPSRPATAQTGLLPRPQEAPSSSMSGASTMAKGSEANAATASTLADSMSDADEAISMLERVHSSFRETINSNK